MSAASSDAVDSVEKLSALHNRNVTRLPETNRSKDNIRMVFDHIEQHPIIDIRHTAAELDISYNTASAAIEKMVRIGILLETTNASRNRVFVYEEYLAILRKDT